VDEVSDPPATDASFRIIRVFREPKNSLEQASALMVHLFFDVFWHVRRRGGLFPWIACAKMVTALLHFRGKRELPPIDGRSLTPESSVKSVSSAV
jgi:hypothetical protein